MDFLLETRNLEYFLSMEKLKLMEAQMKMDMLI